MMNLEKISIIIPVFNEEKNIPLLIEGIQNEFPNIYICIVDDGSIDSTQEILKSYTWSYVSVISHNTNTWLTASIISGLHNCKTWYFVVIDWDLQHPIEKIHDFISFFDDNADIVIASRALEFAHLSHYRKKISKIGNKIINWKLSLHNIHLKDPLSWFFGWKTPIFQENINKNKNAFSPRGYKFFLEFILCIKDKNYRIAEFDFIFQKRKHWKSKLWILQYYYFLKAFIQKDDRR